ncbi:3,9-dihydroxypterocarpan 6A-monooxygenase [Ananas comosus]|uniref:3,9-dihydroxypterocarpan 6A-monooxygenase n=1 Tax=Ananas comosus TaxID=4615 RepID=A0A199VJ80_ANACO|nr:3,9-dihydroxypterocarpan 6A-monooxygenase [Ananas comosus]
MAMAMAMDELKPYSVVVVVILPIVVVFFFFLLRPRRGGAGPRALPVVGHLHLLAPLPHRALAELAGRHRGAPLLRLRLGAVPCAAACSAAAAAALLRGAHDPSVSDRPAGAAVRRLTYGGADFSFAPLGPYWRFVKKLCVDRLLGAPTLARLRRVRTEELRAMLAAVRRNAEETAAVDAEDVRKVVEEVAELTGKFNVSDYIGFCKNWDLQGFNKRLDDVHRRFDTMVEKAIKEKEAARAKARERQTRKEEEEEEEDAGKDSLDILLDIYEDEGAEMRLSRENIKAFILLINHPDILRKAVAEIDSVVGKHRLVNESDIPNLPYLQAIVKETLRLHPTGPLIVRKSSADCTVGGCHIPAGTTLFVNVWAIGRDPEHYKDPSEFRPERFLQGGEQYGVDVRGQHFHFIPFGTGRRSCPGTSLAMLLVQAALGAMLQCFEWRVEGGTVDMAEGPGITLPRASPLVCTPVNHTSHFYRSKSSKLIIILFIISEY